MEGKYQRIRESVEKELSSCSAHDMEHIIRAADRVIVLRTGKRVGSIDFKDYSGRGANLHNDIVKLITGAEFVSPK